ncbi:MAG: hypothetical protein KGM49_06125 [Sphingomonadales bacterium]|nr:hypothetical protein [Sphingomonadales bacterium]
MSPIRMLAVAAMACVARPALAADEEIQVYQDEMGAPGEIGLDLHINYVADGDGRASYPGEESPLHRWRFTPELSVGLGHGFELGAYVPLATLAADGTPRTQGAKMRLKWVAPHGARGFYWGANLEVGRVSHRIDQNPWNGEMKLIAGWRNDRIVAAVNANLGFKISGPASAPAEAEIASKLAYRLSPRVAVGMESYNGLGPLSDIHPAGAGHSTFAVLDAALGKWDVNIGIGKGYSGSADSTVLKFIIGVPLR